MKHLNNPLSPTATLAFLATFCASIASQAIPVGFVDHGTSTTHVPQNLEWLDLTVTANRTYDAVVAELATDAGLGAQGWRFATDEELQILLSDFFGISYTGGPFSDPPLGAGANLIVNDFISLFGDTFDTYLGSGGANSFGLTASSTTSGYANGFYLSSVGSDNKAQARFVLDFEVFTTSGDPLDLIDNINGHAIDASTNFADLGSWLVRPSPVPVPAIFPLVLLALAGLGCCHKRQRRLCDNRVSIR